MRPQPATADDFFRSVDTVEALIDARCAAREALPFEETVPFDLRASVARFGPQLAEALSNGKLLEIVSRLEMDPDHAQWFFSLYGLDYSIQNPLHSTPAYLYFLPAQAAHVIRTSVEAR